ncbi:glycosyltransferase WbuB [Pseudomonas sp. J237]|nr:MULTISPECIES: glycosyltransferase family 4 protein [Pseudomonas]OEO25422.1 glycosyltransferase WbuB [Pseudomonas sp. J237]
MRILIVSQYYWPESFIINELSLTLARQGHQVTVATGKPNYPGGDIFEGYCASGVQEERYYDLINVIRVPVYPRGSGGGRKIVLNYLSFIFMGLWYFPQKLKGKDIDVILVFAPSPILQAIPAIFLKWVKRAHLAIWVQDLWPQSLKATGFIRNRFALRAVGLLVRCIYSFANTLLVQSQAFISAVGDYARRDKIIYYPNSYQDSSLQPSITTQIPTDLLALLEGYFCLVFAGNLGKAQSVDTLMQTAEYLKHLPNCKLVLVGSGSMTGWLEEQKVIRGLDNLILAGRFPAEEMPQFFSRAAGLLVTLKQEQIFAYTIPSKIQAYLAAGRPILAALDGEGARVVEEAGAGLTSPAEDAVGLALRIEQLYRMSPAERDELGRAGRRYYFEHFEMNLQCLRLADILKSRMKEAGAKEK